MSSTTIPLSQGNDYQARFFWLQASRLFQDHTKVIKVGFEIDSVRAFDDVAVYFGKPIPDGQGGETTAHYYQVKFHVANNGAFTWRNLADPEFINASSVSLLQRLHQAQAVHATDVPNSLFWIMAPWAVDHNDPLGDLLSNHNCALRLDRLFDHSGPRSTMGRIRQEWRKHLGLADDDALHNVLKPLRIRANAPSLDQLRLDMNQALLVAGLAPVSDDQQACIYDDLIRKVRQTGQQVFVRSEIEAIAKREGLWCGRQIPSDSGVRVGVRSFLRFAEHIEDETDELLCLLVHFQNRTIRDARLWSEAIFSELDRFLRRVCYGRSELYLQLDAHSTVAFAAGYVLDTKCGVNVVPLQRTRGGLTPWPSETVPPASDWPDWSFTTEDLSPDGQDCALVISATHDILADARLFIQQNLRSVRRILTASISPRPSTTSIMGGAHVLMLTQSVYHWVRQHRTFDERRGTLHMFTSVPNALAFRLGQEARGLGRCQLYEYDFDQAAPGGYVPSLGIPL